jgi:hypothetical protein
MKAFTFFIIESIFSPLMFKITTRTVIITTNSVMIAYQSLKITIIIIAVIAKQTYQRDNLHQMQKKKLPPSAN